MQYTGLSEVYENEPPTYNCVGIYDGIASYRIMQSRINAIKANGTNAEIEIFKGRESSPADLMHIQDNLASFCFGDTYTRGTFDMKMRELLTMSALAALGTEPQLKGHIAGNFAVGNSRETIIGAFTAALPYIGFPRTLNAIRCLEEVEAGMKKSQPV